MLPRDRTPAEPLSSSVIIFRAARFILLLHTGQPGFTRCFGITIFTWMGAVRGASRQENKTVIRTTAHSVMPTGAHLVYADYSAAVHIFGAGGVAGTHIKLYTS